METGRKVTYVKVGFEVPEGADFNPCQVGDVILGAKVIAVFPTTKKHAELNEFGFFAELETRISGGVCSMERAVESATESLENASRMLGERMDELFEECVKAGVRGVGTRLMFGDGEKALVYEIVGIVSDGFRVPGIDGKVAYIRLIRLVDMLRNGSMKVLTDPADLGPSKIAGNIGGSAPDHQAPSQGDRG